MSALYHWPEYSAYECLGCGELIEIPVMGILRQDHQPVAIRHNPENFLIWREMVEKDHEPCGVFKDVRMAQQARQFRKPVVN